MTAVRSSLILCLIIAAVAGSISFQTRVYVVREDETITQLLWNAREAYIVTGRRRTFWDGNRIQFYWLLLREALIGFPSAQTANRLWLEVTTIDAQGVRRRALLDGKPFTQLYVVDDGIYAVIDQHWQRWNGAAFEPSADIDLNRVVGRGSGPQFTNKDGWSSRINLLDGGEGDYPLELGGRSLILSSSTSAAAQDISLTMPNGERVRVLALNEAPRRVDRDEYEALMTSPITASR